MSRTVLISCLAAGQPCPSLLTTAACSGLRPEPDCRPRRTFLHLSHSCASPFGPAILVTHDPMRDIGCQFCCDAPCPHSSVFETQHARKNCGDCTTPDARLADQVDRPSWSQQISSSDVALLRRSLQRRDSHSCHLCYTAARSSSASAGRHGQAPEVCD